MAEQWIYPIPFIDLVSSKESDFAFGDEFAKGSIGISIFLSILFSYMRKQMIPCTAYLFGKGVISNEFSEKFANFKRDRPDLLLCRNAIFPKTFVEVKSHPHENVIDFVNNLAVFYVCEPDAWRSYVFYSKKIPTYLVMVFYEFPLKYTKEIKFQNRLVGFRVKRKFEKFFQKRRINGGLVYQIDSDANFLLRGINLLDDIKTNLTK